MQGVWVLATIKGSVAARAGVQQGDQVLAVNGQDVQGQTAYRVAAMIQTQSQPHAQADTTLPQSATVRLQVGASAAQYSPGDDVQGQAARCVWRS